MRKITTTIKKREDKMENLQQWANDNDVIDVQFYPKNISATSASELISDADKAIKAYQNGECQEYVDPIDRN